MTGSELTERLYQQHPELVNDDDVDNRVKLIFKAIKKHLIEDGRLEIREFGVLDNQILPPKRARNLKSVELIAFHERCRPHFKPGKALLERAKYHG